MRNYISLLFVLTLNIAFGQKENELQGEIRTLFQNENKQKTYGGYGSPIFGIGQFDDQWNVMIGGKGGIIINRKIALGLIGIGKIGNTSLESQNPLYDQLELSYGAGGVFVEYFAGMEKPIHFSFPLHLMAGMASVENNIDNENDQDLESSGLISIEPGINIEFNMSRYFVPTLQLSYRKVLLNSSMDYVNENDLSGLYLGLNFKFGKF